MRLQDAFPSWLVEMTRIQGISTTITVLKGMGDSPTSKALYQSYAGTLTSWAVTIHGQPSTATLVPLQSQFVANATQPIRVSLAASSP